MVFSAGRVLRQSISILLARLPVFVVIAAVLFTPVFVVSLIVGPGATAHGHAAEAGEAQASRFSGLFVVGILAFLAQYLVAGAAAYVVGRHRTGEKVSFVDAVFGGIRRLLPHVDVAFVTGVLVGIGFLVFVVPGAILACVLFVAVPAALHENLDVTRALRRSAALTRGHRTSLLVVLLATLGPMMIVGILVPTALADSGRTLSLLVGAHAQVLFGLLAGISQAVAYHDLRATEEG